MLYPPLLFFHDAIERYQGYARQDGRDVLRSLDGGTLSLPERKVFMLHKSKHILRVFWCWGINPDVFVWFFRSILLVLLGGVLKG